MLFVPFSVIGPSIERAVHFTLAFSSQVCSCTSSQAACHIDNISYTYQSSPISSTCSSKLGESRTRMSKSILLLVSLLFLPFFQASQSFEFASLSDVSTLFQRRNFGFQTHKTWSAGARRQHQREHKSKGHGLQRPRPGFWG